MDWIDVVHGRCQWMAFVNTVMNFRVSYSVGKFLNS
jgi:hypothetical protein